MGGPQVDQPTLSPEQLALQERAKTDRIDSIRERVSAETRDTLIRFGRRKAFAGVGSGLGGGVSLAPSPSYGVFGGRLNPFGGRL